MPAARSYRPLVAGADQGQGLALRHSAAQPLPGERAPQIVGKRRAGAHRVDAGLLARMGRHRRDIAGCEDCGVGRRAIGLVDDDKTALVERQAGIREPRRTCRFGDPQSLVEFDHRAVLRDQPARLNAHNRIVGDRAHAALAEDDLETAADRVIVRRQQPLARDQRHLRRRWKQASETLLRRYRQFDPAGAATDNGQPHMAQLTGAIEERLPALAEPVDRLDRDSVLGGARHIAHSRRRADVER